MYIRKKEIFNLAEESKSIIALNNFDINPLTANVPII